jgi:hypothetical protein
MPTIRKIAPLLPEGEYAAQALKVGLEWSKPKPLPNGGKSESVQMFRIPLRLPDGRMITKFVRVTEQTGWVFESILKSGELVAPEGEEFVLTPDDLEGRRFYFGVKHEQWNGATVANVRFHSKTYACQLNPALEGVTFPNEAPRGVPLRAATPSIPSKEQPPEAGSTAPQDPLPPPRPAGESKGLDDLSEEEFQQAIDYAKQLRAKKSRDPWRENPPDGGGQSKATA